MERIFPLPRPVREALMDKYCPPRICERVAASEADKVCLVRPYFGRIKYGKGDTFFTLRNFKLHADQMKDIGMDTQDVAKSMAHAMAILHWHTKIDANDVEFVLGSSPVEEQKVRRGIDMASLHGLNSQSSTYERVTHTDANFTRRITSIWLIDYDDCHDITMDEAGVDNAVKAFVDTNHYCPRPHSGREFIDQCWDSFMGNYISFSYIVLDKQNLSSLKPLAKQFVDKVLLHFEEKKKAQDARGARQSSGSWSYAPSQSSQSRDQGGPRGTTRGRHVYQTSWRSSNQAGSSSYASVASREPSESVPKK